ncbi:SDR family NAD(P)-dependent oxidoreductase [Anaerocolumna sedimenticola]|uniref:SDR family NAD(P)-dependent oxidoreductase n=1 Tax=Anaerocolumna sedimenticola TaxID=2696063 RepID=A0A6P1TMZ2_9FIRM|nr:SDR family oxidoreductase [Anaerocolumna sedimenticola]QHQ61697.1 SDR family NAD(P)-dependent oxidoreductase [Anaerocolumna sedimenticola]
MKAAIVTGASSGIGLEISKILINNQYRVYGIGRDFNECNLPSEDFIKVSLDLTKTSELITRIKEIRKSDEIHILINNAGVGYFGPHEELNPGKIHEMVTVNLETPLVLTQLLLRDLKKFRGYIINISSVTAFKSNTHGCAYGATKAGLSSFSDSLFDEVRKYGVKVITIHPDMTRTNFYRNAGFCEGITEDTYVKPEEVADSVDFILNQREGMVISEITLKPQKHQIRKL